MVVGVTGIYFHWLNMSGKHNGFSTRSPRIKKAGNRNGCLNPAQLPGYLGASEVRDKDGLEGLCRGEEGHLPQRLLGTRGMVQSCCHRASGCGGGVGGKAQRRGNGQSQRLQQTGVKGLLGSTRAFTSH